MYTCTKQYTCKREATSLAGNFMMSKPAFHIKGLITETNRGNALVKVHFCSEVLNHSVSGIWSPTFPHRKESPLATLLRNPIKPSDYCAYPVKSDQPSVRLLHRQCRWCIGEMKKAGGGRLISRERRKTDDETKERKRKEGGIMGIERQTLTRLISAPAV